MNTMRLWRAKGAGVATLLAILLALSAPPLAAQITADEQAMLYEINRARNDPQRYDAENALAGILAPITASPPLAVNDALCGSARFHANEMAANDYFAHQSAVTGDWPNKMERDAGYPLDSSFSDDANNVESIAGGYADVLTALKELIIDTGTPSLGHRYHILAWGDDAASIAFQLNFREAGAGHASNPPPGSFYGEYYAFHTGYRDADQPFLTGVVYGDTNNNGRFDQGEGLSGVTVTANGTTALTATSNAHGGWAIGVSNGIWAVSAAGGGFSGTASSDVTVTDDNIEIDFKSGYSAGEAAFANQREGGGSALIVSETGLSFSGTAMTVPTEEQTFTLSGSKLNGDLTLTAPADFEISLTSGTGFTTALTITRNGSDAIGTTTIYARYVPTSTTGAASGDILLSVDDNLAKLVAVDGTHPVVLDITTASLPNAIEGSLYSPDPIQAEGGSGGYIWTLDVAAPVWLAIDNATGELSGTPPAGTAGTSVSFTVTVTDSSTDTSPETYTISITAPPASDPFASSGGGCTLSDIGGQGRPWAYALAALGALLMLRRGHSKRRSSM